MIVKSADISRDERFRWWLRRDWNAWYAPHRRVAFVMLNPSTADAVFDDATIRRVTRFAQRWGYTGMVVVNLYPYRTKTPSLLVQWAMHEPHHDLTAHLVRNRQVVVREAQSADLIVAAWGAGAWDADHVAEYVRAIDRPLYCPGLTSDGSPKHPLARGKRFVPADIEPEPYWTPP